MKTIYLIRHGEIPHTKPRHYIGQTDLSLTEYGEEQVKRLGESLAPYSIQNIVLSPLLRCQQSGQILRSIIGASVETKEGLAEIDLGDWEDLTAEQIKKLYPGAHEARGNDMVHYRPANGESFDDLRRRVWPVFQQIVDAMDENVAIVAHAGVNRVLLSHILGMPPENLFRLGQTYACFNIIHFKNDAFKVESLNITS